MHSWFTKKLSDMVELARYCNFPMLQAHFLMSQRAVDTLYASKDSSQDDLAEIIQLLINQAQSSGQTEVQNHLECALKATGARPEKASKVISIDFRTAPVGPKSDCNSHHLSGYKPQ